MYGYQGRDDGGMDWETGIDMYILLCGASHVVQSPANAGDTGSILGGEDPLKIHWNGNPFQDSCLGNPTARGAWQVTVHGVTESQTPLSD